MVALYQQYIDTALEKNLIYNAAGLLQKLCFFQYNRGQNKEALSNCNLALTKLSGLYGNSHLDILDIQENLAIILDRLGDREKAHSTYTFIIEEFKKYGIRSKQAIASFNFALTLSHQKKFLEAETLYREIMQVGEDLGVPWFTGAGSKGLGYVNQLQSKHSKAVTAFRNAIKYQEKANDDPVAIADTNRLLGLSLDKIGKHDEAIHHTQNP